ncbi:MAG: hypothetical protein HYX47_09555 [Burkholderiales bacterium]|nr:hypothetical protein [Burkholderiales bacterium]
MPAKVMNSAHSANGANTKSNAAPMKSIHSVNQKTNGSVSAAAGSAAAVASGNAAAAANAVAALAAVQNNAAQPVALNVQPAAAAAAAAANNGAANAANVNAAPVRKFPALPTENNKFAAWLRTFATALVEHDDVTCSFGEDAELFDDGTVALDVFACQTGVSDQVFAFHRHPGASGASAAAHNASKGHFKLGHGKAHHDSRVKQADCYTNETLKNLYAAAMAEAKSVYPALYKAKYGIALNK